MRVPPSASCLALVATLASQSLTELDRKDALAVVELQPRIDTAIDRAAGWLMRQQERDGSWSSAHTHYFGGQTALSCYTLLKAGLPNTHPAVRRALAHLTTVETDKVYAASTMLMALSESKLPEHRRQIDKLLGQLLGWQKGSWPYPTHGEDTHHDDQDLSLTQFALLGLRAAARAGANVPAKAWQDAAKTTLRYQERPREVGEGAARMTVAGFRYRLMANGDSTGSMTTAGISALCIAREGMGKSMPAAMGREIEQALATARSWLTHHFDVRKNPSSDAWLHYYLYGLERASALLGVAYYGDRCWYLEGARALLETQHGNGSWGSDADTCFAILFLKRATAATTGAPPKDKRAFLADDAREDVAIRAQGGENGDPLSVWVMRVGEPNGLRSYAVEKVTYLVDGDAVVYAEGDGKPWRATETFHAEWQPAAPGQFQIAAEVEARRVDAEGKPVGETVTLRCKGFKVHVEHVWQPWMADAATWRARSLLRGGARVTASASSQLDDGKRAEFAVDGVEGTQWISARDDPAPRLVLEFDRPITARTLVFTQANGSRAWIDNCDLVRKVHLYVNGGKEPLVVEIDGDGLAPVVVDMQRNTRVRRIDLAVVEHSGGKRNAGACGFGEVWLQK